MATFHMLDGLSLQITRITATRFNYLMLGAAITCTSTPVLTTKAMPLTITLLMAVESTIAPQQIGRSQ